ncbi:hypothetical protein [Acetobacterium sp.]|uniref:hypothetical protein n=1 Tax=Acetobacterium sp. TaxID=1872094 RepID=UPI003593C557
MSELDKMMSCLGFNETTVKNYGNAIPFTSRKLDIIGRINQASVEKARHLDLSALFYIFSIAFLVMVMRFIVFAQTGDATIIKVFTSIAIRYSQQLQNSLNVISFLVSVVICVGTGVMINHLKNDNHFC